MPSDRQKSGSVAEQRAADFLKNLGFQIVRRNYRSRFGEIDLIAVRRDLMCFVEVKARSDGRFGSGAEAVTRDKQRKLIRTAQMYITLERKHRFRTRFDVIEVDLSDDAA
ncbi:MAG: YraN family protein, partial [Candidatus Dadabacteria bacterium]